MMALSQARVLPFILRGDGDQKPEIPKYERALVFAHLEDLREKLGGLGYRWIAQ